MGMGLLFLMMKCSGRDSGDGCTILETAELGPLRGRSVQYVNYSSIKPLKKPKAIRKKSRGHPWPPSCVFLGRSHGLPALSLSLSRSGPTDPVGKQPCLVNTLLGVTAARGWTVGLPETRRLGTHSAHGRCP